ncbi:MAG: hypothetical protein KDE00_03730 [Rhodobacteraceae bacterium]|nr:hypothetical protein [Paracoccaceae bacterium]
MHIHAHVAAVPGHRHPLGRPPANLGGLVRDQLRKITSEGFTEVDVRWNSIVLSIEGQNAQGFVRRVFNGSGACVMEKVDRDGRGVERYYDSDGITLLSEEMFDTSANR